jgi:hypothetical protein
MKGSSERIRRELIRLLSNFEAELSTSDLRKKVLALVPILRGLRNLGKSLVPRSIASAGRDRILYYFKKYTMTVINGDELLIVSGIQDWPRRVRELRVQFGWAVFSGITARQMQDQDDYPKSDECISKMKPDDYIMVDANQDRDAAHRWNLANSLRRESGSSIGRMLRYFRANVGRPVTGEELRYVANNASEWARRVRELRTQHGWPIATKNNGRPDLPVGYYVLQADRQSPEHDRSIPDSIRGEVLRRDHYKCAQCGWSHEDFNPSDPRHLELHHKTFHVKGGSNKPENLITLCTVCHDKLHRRARDNRD